MKSFLSHENERHRRSLQQYFQLAAAAATARQRLWKLHFFAPLRVTVRVAGYPPYIRVSENNSNVDPDLRRLLLRLQVHEHSCGKGIEVTTDAVSAEPDPRFFGGFPRSSSSTAESLGYCGARYRVHRLSGKRAGFVGNGGALA